MFTGIITELGTVESITPLASGVQLSIFGPETVSDATVGASISVNGVCLTAIERTDTTFSVEAVDETLSRTSLGFLSEGDAVNLERPMSATGRFDGHIVQGHVDGVGTVLSIAREVEAARYRVSMPSELSRYVVEKGSITVDGVSLTVTAVSAVTVDESWFEIVLIPHTLAVTAFGGRESGARLNLEVDVIAKYLERLVGSK